MDAFFEIVLRVPTLIVLDHILATNFGIKKQSNYEFMKLQIDSLFYNKTSLDQLGPDNLNNTPINANESEQIELIPDDATLFTIYFNLLVFALSFTLFLLSSKHIKRFYLCLMSISILSASNYSNFVFISFLNLNIKDIDKISIFDYKLIIASLISYVAQLILVELLYLITRLSSNGSTHKNSLYIKKHISRILFLIPTILGVLVQPSANLLQIVSFTIASIVFFDLFVDWIHFIMDVYRVVTEDYTWCKNVIKYHGLLYLLELQWQRLMIPHVLKTFWITKFFYQLFIILSILLMNFNYFENDQDNKINNQPLISKKDLLLFIIKQLSIAGCETIICVSGMSSILCSILNKLGQLIQKFLIAIDDGEDRNLGKISAILFFVLALQTGLTEISAELRFVRLYRNLCLLLTANLYIIHGMVNPLLLSLSASKNRSLNRHARPLIACFLLKVFPSWFLFILWKHNQLSTWLLAVSTFCVEMVIRVNLTLLIYSLYMIDAYRSSIWEKLDDYVFYIKSLQSAIQFVFSVFIFCNGAWILVYESGGAIRAMMISIHAYFNIWSQAKEGWKVFSKRRKAVSKLDLLKDATAEQLSELNDVCAICYQELTSAKITLCNHYFHSTCLRKWLNVQDQCPLCLQICFKTNEDRNSTTEDINELNNNASSSFSNSSNNRLNNLRNISSIVVSDETQRESLEETREVLEVIDLTNED